MLNRGDVLLMLESPGALVKQWVKMARTKQTARKSTRGKVPRKQLATKALTLIQRMEKTQQELPACKPILTPRWVISAFMLVSIVFIPIEVASLFASRDLGECDEEHSRWLRSYRIRMRLGS